IDDEVVTLIDAGTGDYFDEIARGMEVAGLSPKDIDLLVNTHCHFDHAGGNPGFIKASGCEVAIHKLEADYLRRGDNEVTCASMFGREMESVEVQRELEERDKLDLGEMILEVINTPGHTAGSISLYDPAKKILFTGDAIFCDGVGRTDLPTGDEKALVASLNRLAKLDSEQMYPGHGPFLTSEARKCIVGVTKRIYL
ncbi:MAG: MBL fold metallo-hydrolase, partial [Candidatus Hadarchaeota archaeon]